MFGILATIVVGCLSGCTPYQFGNASMFPQNIRTVHVPVIRNATFREDLGVRLTEALNKEIELRTPYKVTADPLADTVLRCEVVDETKRVLTENDADYVRALDAAIQVRASWSDRQGRLLMKNSIVPTDDLTILFSQDERFVPEAGQSIDTATQKAIEDLANRIVSQMEARW
ncbi:putative transmembrane region and signal peptide protein [Rhodopirellula islandica]|uniref:Transmembrane region and signal peptide protein n=1 Tax=Rhodopirellula islandica TaxID=595434 RepID=A0A0J1EIY8_RHOIS|nr:putative transmembrane region and signal peptide protein [Rhodopirellula islandica]